VSTNVELYERHLQWLSEHCRVTSFVDLVSRTHGSNDGRPLVAITFDDGYTDNHSYALPILLKYGVSATFFITAGFVERDPVVLRRFEHLLGSATDHLVPLDWSQVRELRASGMDIGSHTYSHPNLARLSQSEVTRELRMSKEVISDRLGYPVDLFAYPFGKPRVHFTSVTIDAVRSAGYRMAAAVIFRSVGASDSLLSIPRFFVDGDTIGKLEAKIRGGYEVIGWWQDHVPISVMRIASPDDFTR
jgi:peptidoglycan/xylan/chitin deacetylase (PgdA/CDA1 family)